MPPSADNEPHNRSNIEQNSVRTSAVGRNEPHTGEPVWREPDARGIRRVAPSATSNALDSSERLPSLANLIYSGSPS